MQISVQTVRETKVVTVEGKLDTGTAERAEAFFNQLLDGGARRVLVNLTSMDYITSAGLRVLLAAAQTLDDLGGEMRLYGLNPSVATVFRITGFDGMLKVFPQEADAAQGW